MNLGNKDNITLRPRQNFDQLPDCQVDQDLVVGLDVGTTKICVVVGATNSLLQADTAGLKILTIGTSESKGLKKGIVVDVEEATRSISKALKEAESKIRIKIDSVYIGIAGGHIKSFNGYGIIGIRERKVTEKDIERLIDMASASYVPVDREVLQVIPTGFSIDGVNGIIDPLGKRGRMLEARVHIVTGAITPVQNLIRCCEASGVSVADLVFEPIASTEAVLSEEERDRGILMIDIGGGTTDIAIFKKGILKHTASFPIGGNHITNDIAIGLDLTIEDAERVKRAYGLSQMSDDNEEMVLEGRGKISLSILSEIVYLRCEEIFSLIKKEIISFFGSTNKEDLPNYIKGIVLTGGTSLLKGIDRLAERIFSRPTRIGIPKYVTNSDLKNPIYSTGIGLVLFGQRLQAKQPVADKKGSALLSPLEEDKFSHLNVLNRMKYWVTGFLNKK